MTTQESTVETEEKGNDESIAWFVRLCDDQPEKVVVIAICAVAVGGIGFFVFHQAILAVIGFLTILATTAEFWLGTHYKLDSKSVSARCGFSLTSMDWASVKRVTVNADLIRVSPLEKLTRLEPFRGVLLRTLPQEGEHVLKFVRTHCKEDVRILGRGASGVGSGAIDREGGERNSSTEDGDSSDSRD